MAEAEAAQKYAALYERGLRPRAEATLHAAVVAYENNKTDFLNLLDSQMAVIGGMITSTIRVLILVPVFFR